MIRGEPKYQLAKNMARRDFGFTLNLIRSKGKDWLFQMLEEKGRVWDEKRKVWLETDANGKVVER